MKVIFLDIDGVVNVCYSKSDQYGSEFHPEFVENLRHIIDNTGAKIVCSSSWRKSGLAIIKEMWAYRNLPGEVIDVTPSLYLNKGVTFYNDYLDQHPTPKTFGYSVPRGCEIQYWLKNFGNFQRINWSPEVQAEYLQKAIVKNYLILDDDSDFLYCQREHFVKCSCQQDPDAIEGYGLTKSVAQQSVEILSKSIIELYYPASFQARCTKD